MTNHPAKFSRQIVERIGDVLDRRLDIDGGTPRTPVVLDPWAGTGRIHDLSDRGYRTIGVEIEPEWADLNDKTICGDSTDLLTVLDPHVAVVDAVATSPCYGNRMADRLLREGRKDYTYTGYHSGLGRQLHENNSGGMQWGDEYRAHHERVWELVAQLGPSVIVVNVKDHRRTTVRGGPSLPQGVALWHTSTLGVHGYRLTDIEAVPARGQRHGANKGSKIAETEWVLGFVHGSLDE